MGSNAFIVPSGIISYSDGKHSGEVLRVKSVHNDKVPGSVLSVDLEINDTNGARIKLINNIGEFPLDFNLTEDRDSVKVFRPDGKLIINIQQLDTDSAMALEHNIVAELEVNDPISVIRIFGDFKTGNLSISAENEKLYINNNGYATSALAGKNQLLFTADGAVL